MNHWSQLTLTRRESAGLQSLVITDLQALGAQLISQEPVPELRVISARLQHCVGRIRVAELTVADRGGGPLVVGLTGEAQHPAGQAHGDPVAGQIGHDGIRHFGDWPSFRFAWER